MNNTAFANRQRLAMTALGLLVSAVVFAQQPVLVTNGANQIIPVTGSEVAMNPVLATPNPVQIQLTVQFWYDSTAAMTTFALPAGQRLVIENFSARCKSLYATKQDFTLRLGSGQNTPLTWLHTPVPLVSQGFFMGAIGTGTMPVHAYIDSGLIWVDGERSVKFGVTSCAVTILGYYTPLPQQIAIP